MYCLYIMSTCDQVLKIRALLQHSEHSMKFIHFKNTMQYVLLYTEFSNTVNTYNPGGGRGEETGIGCVPPSVSSHGIGVVREGHSNF